MTVPPERVVVRAPNWLGDVMLSLGALRDLRRAWPTAHLEVLALPRVAPIYDAVAEVDGVRTAATLPESVRALRGSFDTAVVLPNSFRSALEPFLAGVPQRWGHATDGRRLLLTRHTRPAPRVRGESEAFYYRSLVSGLGLPVAATPNLAIACPEVWQTRAREMLEADGLWVGLNPGASFGTAKRWPPERFAAVAETAARDLGARIVIVGSEPERPLAEEIAAQIPSGPVVLAGRTSLPDLVGVISLLGALVTNDSGPMHVAAALGVPVVAVFGPTDWRETAPRSSAARVVREPVDCAPCKLRECPTDHRCMERVTSRRVFEALADQIAQRPQGGQQP